MANKMLIDSTHPEETRVVVVRGNRVEDFDFEAANRRQLRGNIYLAKVTRVEPSLQACFVEYGGNRHGFLAFSEIHPDYYQIPVADRQALIAEEERDARADDAKSEPRKRRAKAAPQGDSISETPNATAADEVPGETAASDRDANRFPPASGDVDAAHEPAAAPDQMMAAEAAAVEMEAASPIEEVSPFQETSAEPEALPDGESAEAAIEANGQAEGEIDAETVRDEDMVESVGGGDALEEIPVRSLRRRAYKIQEVVKRRQVLLIQVVKEERGTKGAALTTYLSLAGRYSVLMPNTARGGGISRKITSITDRKRLKELVEDLEVPQGMGVILRTAGASRTKTEIKRDFEYLLRLWETVRELTLKSVAPELVYEEGSLVKRSIRDLYNKDIDEVLVAGDEAYREAKDFMRMLTPSHAKNVKPYKESQPLFARFGVESQLDAMFSPVVQLKSGGYIVINPTEALVSIDVNSGRATREHHIEDTALRTNLEASEEISRQLRLRDLAGLIVIDFIDMDESRNNRAVERKLKDCLKNDRARIQIGRISHFGLMEMSRQRIRTGVLESSSVVCASCGGTGHVRSIASIALQLLRSLEDHLLKSATHDLIVRCRPEAALYLLNHKRAHLRELEQRFGIAVLVQSDTTLTGQVYFQIDKGTARATPLIAPKRVAPDTIAPIEAEDAPEEDDEEAEEAEEADASEAAEPSAPSQGREAGPEGRGRRRRRRRGGRNGEPREPRGEPVTASASAMAQPAANDEDDKSETIAVPLANGSPDAETRRRRRRGRRGGRRNRRDRVEGESGQPAGNPEMQTGGQVLESDAEHDGNGAFRAEMISHPAPHPPGELPVFPPTVRPMDAEAPPASADQTPAPKRRSTVREPAPGAHPVENWASVSASSPPAEARPSAPASPASPAPGEPIDADQPRKTGWWRLRS